jgi:hypothetical protein
LTRNILFSAALLLFASVAVFRATGAPTLVADDGYDHSYEGLPPGEAADPSEAGY